VVSDHVFNVSTLWQWGEDVRTISSILPKKLGSRTPTVLWWLYWYHRCVPGLWEPGGIPHLPRVSLPPRISTAWRARDGDNNLVKLYRGMW